MNIITHPAVLQHLQGPWGIQGTHSLLDWIILTFREAWPSKGNYAGHVGPWKSIGVLQQILRELGMTQAIYAPVFEGPDWATFTAGMRAKILQSATVHGIGH